VSVAQVHNVIWAKSPNPMELLCSIPNATDQLCQGYISVKAATVRQYLNNTDEEVNQRYLIIVPYEPSKKWLGALFLEGSDWKVDIATNYPNNYKLITSPSEGSIAWGKMRIEDVLLYRKGLDTERMKEAEDPVPKEEPHIPPEWEVSLKHIEDAFFNDPAVKKMMSVLKTGTCKIQNFAPISFPNRRL